MFPKLKILVGIIYFLAYVRLGTQMAAPKEPKVLIIGAGMAGTTVAKTLSENGFQNFLVIEGASRMGGRMKSVMLSDYTVDLGAMWIYGKGLNPVYRLLKEYKIKVVDDPGTRTVRDTSGNDVSNMADMSERRFLRALKSSEAEAKNIRNQNRPDFTFSSGLRNYDWRPQNAIDDVIETVYTDWEFSATPSELSGKFMQYYEPYEEFRSKKSLIVNDMVGYQGLVEAMADSYMTSPDDRIVYNSKVVKVKQDDDGVVVITEDGSRYRGDHVVVAVSLGVMQNKVVKFKPDFPLCKQRAVDKFGFGTVSVIYLKFPEVFWDSSFYLLYAAEVRGRYVSYQNLDLTKPNSMTLRLSVVGQSNSRRLQGLSDKGVIKDVMRCLQDMYPNATIPDPSAYYIQKWGQDPLVLGAWSYWPPAFTEANMEDMQAPFGRVYFAGEYLNNVHYGYVHGAHMSGNKTAYDIIACLTNPDACPPSASQRFGCSNLDGNCNNDDGPRFG